MVEVDVVLSLDATRAHEISNFVPLTVEESDVTIQIVQSQQSEVQTVVQVMEVGAAVLLKGATNPRNPLLRFVLNMAVGRNVNMTGAKKSLAAVRIAALLMEVAFVANLGVAAA